MESPDGFFWICLIHQFKFPPSFKRYFIKKPYNNKKKLHFEDWQKKRNFEWRKDPFWKLGRNLIGASYHIEFASTDSTGGNYCNRKYNRPKKSLGCKGHYLKFMANRSDDQNFSTLSTSIWTPLICGVVFCWICPLEGFVCVGVMSHISHEWKLIGALSTLYSTSFIDARSMLVNSDLWLQHRWTTQSETNGMPTHFRGIEQKSEQEHIIKSDRSQHAVFILDFILTLQYFCLQCMGDLDMFPFTQRDRR